MEYSSRKRKTGFMKGKLVKSLYRSAAPTHVPSPTIYYSSSKDDDTPPRTVYHLQLHHHQPKEKLVPFNPNNIVNISLSSSFIVNQDQAAPPQKPKVSYYIPPQSNGTNFCYDKMVDKSYGNENVDMKAAHYISCVKERFRSIDQITC